MTIITDHKWKPFKYRNEVPAKVLDSEFDWTNTSPDEYLDGFLQYRHTWYHLSQFCIILHSSANCPFPAKWDGYNSDSYFSGVLIRLSDDGEEYQVATYIN